MPSLKDILTDPKRTGEHNDCAVVATANVLGIPYAEAHALLHRYGRRNRCGTRLRITRAALESRAKVIERVISTPMSKSYFGFAPRRAAYPTVAQFLRKLPKTGRYFLCSTTHAFAYVDGKLLDNIDGGKMRARMNRCFEVIPVDQRITVMPSIRELAAITPSAPVQAPKPQPEAIDTRPKFNPLKAELERLTAELSKPGADLNQIFERIKALESRMA
jgi:hypothetical protein